MNILLTLKLSDRSLWNHVHPIARADSIDRITIVRDTPGPGIDKVRYIAASQRGLTSPILSFPYKFLQLLRYSIRERPALIHAYMYPNHGYLAFLAGKLTGRRIGVSLIAGPVELFIPGGSPIGNYSYCRPLPSPGLFGKSMLYLLRRFDIITVTGTYTRDFLLQHGVENEKIFILPHIVDSRFRPTPITKDIDVIFVGRLAKVKNVETMIRAIATVKESLPAIRVVIVGDGESKRDLQELTTSLGLDDQIEFAGFQANAWDWYNRSRLSVLTSEREGFPYTVIESLRCGVPPVVSNCGDIGDVVRDGFNGRVIPDYTDDRAYAAVLIELLTDPGQIDMLSRNCLSSVEHLDSNAIVRVWNEILATVGDPTALEHPRSAVESTER